MAMGRAGDAPRRRLRAADSDRGSLILMLAVLFVSLLALAGLVIDGGAKLDADQTATAAAQEAARSGAGIVSPAQAYASGTFAVDQPQALAAAQEYLARAGLHGSAAPDGPEAIRVTVTIPVQTKVLSLIGIDRFTVRESAIAELVTGVTGPAR